MFFSRKGKLNMAGEWRRVPNGSSVVVVGEVLRSAKGVLCLKVATSGTHPFPFLAPDPGSSWVL